MGKPKDKPAIVHPLDQDDEVEYSVVRAVPNAYRPLLKWSVRCAIVAGIFVAAASTVTAVAQPFSPISTTADYVFRVSAGAAMLACFGILAAYRVPQAKAVGLQRFNKPKGRALNIVVLLGLNAVVLVAMWGGWVAVSQTSVLQQQVAAFLPALPFVVSGLSVTMIVFHTGVLRAYGIGVAVVSVMQAQSFNSLFGMQLRGFTTSGMDFVLSQVFNLTIALVTGLLTAIYVAVVVRPPSSQLTSSQATSSQPPFSNDADPAATK